MLRKLFSVLVLTALLGFALPLLGCPAKEKSVSESAQDALDMRDNEAIKDAGEDVQDAVEDAGDAVKDSVD